MAPAPPLPDCGVHWLEAATELGDGISQPPKKHPSFCLDTVP